MLYVIWVVYIDDLLNDSDTKMCKWDLDQERKNIYYTYIYIYTYETITSHKIR